MAPYYLLMALILGLAYPLCIAKPSKKKNIIYVCIVFGYMLIMSSLRYGLGNDYFHYRTYFYNMLDNNMKIKEVMDSYGLELGYVLLMKLAGFLGGEYLYLNIITALLTVVPAGYVVCRRSKIPWVSAWLYLTITFFYNSMNFTRQTIAASIILLGYKFFEEKKHFGVIAVIAAASVFHTSVLIMIPIYLFSLIKPSAKSLGIIGGCGLLTFIFSKQIIDLVLNSLLTRYSKYADSIYITIGLSPKFLIIPAILAGIVITAYFMGMKDKQNSASMAANFMFYNFLIWLFIVKHFIIERFTLPIYIFALIFVPDALIFFKEYAGEKIAPGVRRNSKNTPAGSSGRSAGLKKLYPAVTAAVIISTGIYNDFCIGEGVHGVFPYKSILHTYSSVTEEDILDHARMVYVNAELIDFLSYADMRSSTVVLCVKGGINGKLELPYKYYLRKLGFRTDFEALDGKSYIGVVNNGKAIFEKTGEETLTEIMSFYDGKFSIAAVSGGTEYGNIASLMIHDREFMPNEEGFNFAVFDNEMQRIITAQSYTISGHEYTYGHSNGFNGIEFMPGFEEDFKNGY